MAVVFKKTDMLTDVPLHYCPGCTHGIVHRLVAESLEELGVGDKTIGVAPVGCAVFAYNYFNCDMQEASHGRAPAVATGIKRTLPDRVVFTYQGDGDLASIGTAEIVHAATRGEKFTTIFINNAIYGMTGGQMAPTSLIGQETATSPKGKDQKMQGYPLKISEMLSILPGVKYIERCSLHSPKEILNTKRAIKEGFQNQMDRAGFSLIEVLSNCPTYWSMGPRESLRWMENTLSKEFPLGRIK
jgi:2-oxoglutarate ferredoxin oxidoreductase subunit beta